MTHLLLIGPDGDILGTSMITITLSYQSEFSEDTLRNMKVLNHFSFDDIQLDSLFFFYITAQWGITIIKPTKEPGKNLTVSTVEGRSRCKLTTRIGWDWIRTPQTVRRLQGLLALLQPEVNKGTRMLSFCHCEFVGLLKHFSILSVLFFCPPFHNKHIL